LSVLNRDPAQDMSPVWTPDGKRVVWTSTRGGGNPNLYWQAADGSGAVERLTNNPTNQFPTAVTPDGRSILLFGGAAGVAAIDLFRVELNAATRTASPLMSQPGFEFGGELSPDGKWLAYHSNESGEFQVYVRPYPNLQDGRWQISTTGGSRAAWARNGRELFYLDHNGLLTAVTVAPASGTTFVAGPPMTILKTRYHAGNSLLRLDLRGYDVDADGQRFLMIKEPASAQSAPAVSMTVVLNWTEELKQRLPAR
jgi:serine/threonine-protein kinase